MQMSETADDIENSGVLAGQEQFGRFYLQELLNSGGMAEIWLVTDGRGKPYAMRRLKKELRFNSARTAAFYARAAKCSPN